MTRRLRFLASILAILFVLTPVISIKSVAQTSQKTARGTDASDLNAPASEMRAIIEYYALDRGSLARSYPVSSSPARQARFRKFYADALERIQKLDFDSMSQGGRVDYLLLKNDLEYELRQLDIQSKQIAEIAPLIPFAATIVDLEEARRRMEPIESAKTAATLTTLRKQIDDTRRSVEAGLRGSEASDAVKVKKTVAYRAVGAVNSLRNNLRNWYTFYNGYDPIFT